MVRMVKGGLLASAATAAALGIAGCGAPAGAQLDHNTSVAAASRSTSPAAHPSAPVACDGIGSVGDAAALVTQGSASLLARISINAAPVDTPDGGQVFAVVKATILAGSANNGDVLSVEATGSGAGALPPGSYLVLLGPTAQPGTYYLADGLRGSFAVGSSDAYERCPTDGGQSPPAEIHSGVTSIDSLAALFAQVLPSQSPSTVPSPSASGGPATTAVSPPSG